MGINMRTETEMLDVVLKTAETLQVTAVAMSGSRTDTKASKDEFQDYDVVYVVENLDELITDLSWLDQFGKRIDLTLCPKDHIQEWVDSEAGFTVFEDPEHLFEPYSQNLERYWTPPATETNFVKSCNEFWWVSAYVVKGICRKQVIYATDHLYGICQQEFLKILAWQVASARGRVEIGKNCKYLFNHLPVEKEKELSNLLDFSSLDKITQSLFDTMQLFHREAQILAQKMGFAYDKEIAERMIQYAEDILPNH